MIKDHSVTHSLNNLGQAVGPEVTGWREAAMPSKEPIKGQFCRIEPLNSIDHLDDLYEAFSDDRDGALWTYMPVGPFKSKNDFHTWLDSTHAMDDPQFHAIIDLTTSKAIGLAAYMRIKPNVGVIEVGSITYSPQLQRTRLATEVMFLLMRRAFDELGYRRYEWKCDSLNAASRKAAERLGFSFEGIFRQALVYKGRNRDTAWYSILDRDWPLLKNAYLDWLDQNNFDEHGLQKQKLQHFIKKERAYQDSMD